MKILLLLNDLGFPLPLCTRSPMDGLSVREEGCRDTAFSMLPWVAGLVGCPW